MYEKFVYDYTENCLPRLIDSKEKLIVIRYTIISWIDYIV